MPVLFHDTAFIEYFSCWLSLLILCVCIEDNRTCFNLDFDEVLNKCISYIYYWLYQIWNGQMQFWCYGSLGCAKRLSTKIYFVQNLHSWGYKALCTLYLPNKKNPKLSILGTQFLNMEISLVEYLRAAFWDLYCIFVIAITWH